MKRNERESGVGSIGILMLDTRFPRIYGDMGNEKTWPFPVKYRVVRGASSDLAVRGGGEGLVDAFVEAGRELVADGARAVSTTCGFLSLFQQRLTDTLGVPVATSALMQAAQIQSCLPAGRRVGILTISLSSLTPEHLAAAQVPPDTPVWGLEDGCEMQRVILDDEPHLDVDVARMDMRRAATEFQARHPELGAILFECTNMPPYKQAVQSATGLPVYSIETLLRWLAAAHL